MNTTKKNNMMKSYTGFAGHATVSAVLEQIHPELFDRLTGRELGLVMTAVNDAYHNGRASMGGVDVIDDCVWIPWGGGGDNTTDTGDSGQLIPIAALTKEENHGDGKAGEWQQFDF